MAPKRKGKGKKRRGKALTEEEKQKVAAQKALAEREKIARRQKLTKAFLDIKKEKEYELLKVNSNKILDLWRPILRKQKIQELLEDYKLMQLAFQRSFEKKNVYIDEMEQNLEKNEGEYDQAVDMHLHNIDKMMEFYRNRLAEVKESFLKQRNQLVNSLDLERENIQERHDKSLQFLRDKMATIEREFKQDAHEAKVELYMKEEDMRNSVNQDLQAFRAMMEQKITKMWENIHERILSYEQTTNDRRKEYKKYKDRDDHLSEIIDDQFSRLNVLKDGIKQLDHRMDIFDKAFSKYFDELRAKKQECRDIYNGLMNRQNLLVANAKSHIQHLALSSHCIIEKMDEMLKSREHVLLAMERCRKEEREEEKIDPFMKRWGIKPITMQADAGSGDVDAEAMSGFDDQTLDPRQKFMLSVPHVVHNLKCDCDPCKCPHKFGDALRDNALELELKRSKSDASMAKDTIHNTIKEYSMLEIFWLRFNKVTLEKESLRQRRKGLMGDNHNLRLTLRNYMGSLNPTGLDLVKFTDELAAKDKQFVGRCENMMDLERKRKERCRKVGGVKVH